MNASLTSSGTLPCAIRLQTATNKSVASLSSRRSFKCSYVHPPGPPEKPRGELCRLSKNVLRSNSTGVLGSNSKISGGNSPRWNCGLLACSSRNVSSHFGARHAPVKHEDARLRPIRLRTIRLRPAGRNRNWPKSKLAEIEINWPKSNRWHLLCFLHSLFLFVFCLIS